MDSLLLKSRLVQERELCIAAVCDGVGGLADGAYAASSTVKMLSNWFENLENTDGLGPRLREYIESVKFCCFDPGPGQAAAKRPAPSPVCCCGTVNTRWPTWGTAGSIPWRGTASGS